MEGRGGEEGGEGRGGRGGGRWREEVGGGKRDGGEEEEGDGEGGGRRREFGVASLSDPYFHLHVHVINVSFLKSKSYSMP